MLSVRDACCLFMEKHMDASNCLGVHCFAETLGCERLQEVAREFALRSVSGGVGAQVRPRCSGPSQGQFALRSVPGGVRA